MNWPSKLIPRDVLYMRRYYLCGGDAEGTPNAIHAPGLLGLLPFNLFLQHFYAGDDTLDLHNHPYEWSLSLILFGGYVEERLTIRGIIQRVLRPGMINFISANTFHRIDLRKGECWTLFLTGKKTQQWGFLDRKTFRYRNNSGK